MEKLSHTDEDGRARMVDVTGKPPRRRTARAAGHIDLAPATIALIRDNAIKKGDVLTVARVAGIQAAKQTPLLIPLCHPLALTSIDVRAHIDPAGVQVETQVTCIGPTGVEMEALTAAGVALLTVYDMCKAVDKTMKIGEITLIEKRKEDVRPTERNDS